MNNFTYGITLIAINALVPLILGIVSAHTLKTQNSSNTLTVSKFFLIVGLIGTITITVAFSLCVWQGFENIAAFIFITTFCILFFLGQLWLFLHSMNWKLIIDEEKLIYRNFLGIVREYSYTEITRICVYYHKRTGALEKYKVFLGKRKITVEYIVKNFNRFEYLIKKGLRKAKNRIEFESKFTWASKLP